MWDRLLLHRRLGVRDKVGRLHRLLGLRRLVRGRVILRLWVLSRLVLRRMVLGCSIWPLRDPWGRRNMRRTR